MDQFSTQALIGVVPSLIVPQFFFSTRYYGEMREVQTETVSIDIEKKGRRLAPFVSPKHPGIVREEMGYDSKEFKPAYVKEIGVLDPEGAFKRAIGETLGGDLKMTLMDRQTIRIANTLIRQMEAVNRRLEWMAIKGMLNGGYTVSGAGYQAKYVDFQRDASLNVVLSGSARWNQAGSSPFDDLDNAKLAVQEIEGAGITDVIMDVKTWQVFRKHPAVLLQLDNRRMDMNAAIVAGMSAYPGVSYQGSAGGYDFYTYSDWYTDPDTGENVQAIPEGTVLVAGPDTDGLRLFGAILDEEAGLTPMAMFPNSWMERNPSRRMMQIQSAPLMVPTRINSAAVLKPFG